MDTRVAKLRVLVADDHPSIRENLRYLLNAEADLECIGVVKEPLRCVDLCLELEPDVLVLDRSMPEIDGLQIARTLAQAAPDIKVVFYTLDVDTCASALAAGALACVAKDAPADALLGAIRSARTRAVTA
ncbi:MAG TPA: response regulator transcription factor [Candidatus Limnocylindria bacterium]|nr:response regulator transcription factor [Candidatus Limnocylindria bacterium]